MWPQTRYAMLSAFFANRLWSGPSVRFNRNRFRSRFSCSHRSALNFRHKQSPPFWAIRLKESNIESRNHNAPART